MARLRKRYGGAAVITALILYPILASGQQSAEEIVGRITRVSPQERQRQLLDGARREGGLMIYATFSESSALANAFRKHYPMVKVDVRRLGGLRMLDVSLIEFRSGKHIVDTFIGGTNSIHALIEAGVIARYLSPERTFYEPHFKDEKGYWTAFFSRHLVFAYNTTLVPPEKLPKTYFDLLNPYWKGKFAIDNQPDSWLAGMIKAYGSEKATELLRGLAGQSPRIIRGRTLKAQLLAAGEFQAALDQTEEGIIEMKKKGAPVDYLFLENAPVLTNPVALAKNAPHPHAAALFVDYLLSKEGQQAVMEVDYVPTRQGFKPKDRELAERAAKAKRVFINPHWLGQHQKEINHLIAENLRPNR